MIIQSFARFLAMPGSYYTFTVIYFLLYKDRSTPLPLLSLHKNLTSQSMIATTASTKIQEIVSVDFRNRAMHFDMKRWTFKIDRCTCIDANWCGSAPGPCCMVQDPNYRPKHGLQRVLILALSVRYPDIELRPSFHTSWIQCLMWWHLLEPWGSVVHPPPGWAYGHASTRDEYQPTSWMGVIMQWSGCARLIAGTNRLYSKQLEDMSNWSLERFRNWIFKLIFALSYVLKLIN